MARGHWYLQDDFGVPVTRCPVSLGRHPQLDFSSGFQITGFVSFYDFSRRALVMASQYACQKPLPRHQSKGQRSKG